MLTISLQNYLAKYLLQQLFSGSSVMESRQSRILAENVQLLAFVTIFFLPLAFSSVSDLPYVVWCIFVDRNKSLWSIPSVNEDYPGLTVPGAVAAVIGSITYLVVFNLNIVISALHRLFTAPRKFLLKNMEAENMRGKGFVDWPSRANDFDLFPLPDKGRRPSNWWLLFYAIYLPIRKAFYLLICLWTEFREIFASLPNTATAGSVPGDCPEFAGRV